MKAYWTGWLARVSWEGAAMSRTSKIALVWGLVVVLIVLSFAFHRSSPADDPAQPASQDEVVRRQHVEPPLADLGPPPRPVDRYNTDRYNTDEPPFGAMGPATARKDAVLLAPREIPDAPPPVAPSYRDTVEPEPSQTTVATHRIVDGDTLSGLAERYLGRADRYLELFEANRDSLTHPDLLPIGLELRIPATASAGSSPPEPRTGSRLVPIPRGSFRRQTEYPAMVPGADY
ncbi:MAG: LysM peptidoglycan-binding domain-containing protein [Pirellulales bacterium]